jgi:fibrillarin-like pre-rRNA processing protein
MQEIFQGVYRVEGKIATKSFCPGYSVYGEKTASEGGVEYRLWDPYRSKLGAAIVRGLKRLAIAPGSKVLYLGAASGTTASHVSDIVGKDGIVYCVEFAPRSMRQLISVCEKRQNMLPVMEDARFPERYAEIGAVDVVFEDVADREQARILLDNSRIFLQKGGKALIAIKSRCVSSSEPPERIFAQVERELQSDFFVLQRIRLEPFETDHMLLYLEKK